MNKAQMQEDIIYLIVRVLLVFVGIGLAILLLVPGGVWLLLRYFPAEPTLNDVMAAWGGWQLRFVKIAFWVAVALAATVLL